MPQFTVPWTERSQRFSGLRGLVARAACGVARLGKIRLFDYQVTLHASHGAVTLGDTKEGGLLSVRVAS